MNVKIYSYRVKSVIHKMYNFYTFNSVEVYNYRKKRLYGISFFLQIRYSEKVVEGKYLKRVSFMSSTLEFPFYVDSSKRKDDERGVVVVSCPRFFTD